MKLGDYKKAMRPKKYLTSKFVVYDGSIDDREKFANGGTLSIKEILKNMAEDRTYTPPIDLSAKGRGLPAGFRKAKKELREEIPNFDELYNTQRF